MQQVVDGLPQEMIEQGFTLGGGRYLCTGTGEWLDLVHFFKLAQFGKRYGIGPSIIAGWLNEVGQAIRGDESGAPLGGNEDLFSNQEGAIFGRTSAHENESLENNVMNYINANLGGLRNPRKIGNGSARGNCSCDGSVKKTSDPPAFEKAMP